MTNNAKEGTKLGTVSGHLEISFVLPRRICKGDFGPLPKTGIEGHLPDEKYRFGFHPIETQNQPSLPSSGFTNQAPTTPPFPFLSSHLLMSSFKPLSLFCPSPILGSSFFSLCLLWEISRAQGFCHLHLDSLLVDNFFLLSF